MFGNGMIQIDTMELSGKQTNGQQLTFYRTISYQQNIGIRNVSNKTHNYKTLKNSLLIIFSKKYYFLGYLFWLRVLRDEKENYFNLN
ncbi:conserved hypothetical protein [Sphingobacterium multivorum]|uniref:Uncharacterized protein n=1 Tax=Sphingobacterium multivorum TaxID=28454 RepID=A0A653ZSF4_SPHMU|nr:conserved hypothetical protein [Sphingobacterium multivorum]